MSFNSDSLQKLNELSRKLPQEIPKPANSKRSQKSSSKLHPVETEEDPKKLFHELIKASADGHIPEHLLTRLKHLEEKEFKDLEALEVKSIENATKQISSIKSNKDRQKDSLDPEKSLYISFKQLLLEEED